MITQLLLYEQAQSYTQIKNKSQARRGNSAQIWVSAREAFFKIWKIIAIAVTIESTANNGK